MRKRSAGLLVGATAIALVAAACSSSSKSASTSSTSASTGSSGSSSGSTGGSSGKWTTSHPFKVAFIYVGAPSDAGWTHAHEEGRLAVQSNFGGTVQTMYKENVPEGPQTAQVITELLNQGENMIFATSFGYQDAITAAAKTHPNVLFEQATGTNQLPNLAEYYGAGEDGDYLSGMAAGSASKSGKIGFVAPYAIPEVIREIDAFTMGARSVNPNATVRVVWTNTWFGPSTERSAAESLVAAGVDTLGDGQDSPTTGQVAAASNLAWTGYDSNQESFAPNSWLTATTYNWGPYYINTIKAAMDGTWKTHFYYGGLGDGFVVMAPFGSRVTPQAQAAITAKENQIKAGSFNPFTGPIYKQDGSIGVQAGQTLPVYTPTGLSKYSIDWFVKGVIGSAKG
ncbi:MAG TPA: BMP family ABC transporter substrate-binding protein [Acidimicrobiales bacterium]|nr:BMP family ABC transporter substrate-binding protein [Acidimicrobiales bacterium]